MSAKELDATNYRNGPKNNWRRTCWNAIRTHIRDPRDALTLYLPGAGNLDRPVAIRHGFKPGNLIAIESNPKVAQHIRREHKQTVIDGRLLDVMNAWPAKHRVSVVIADMCTGFDGEAIGLLPVWVGSEAFRNSCLVLNVMRGRERGVVARKIRTEHCIPSSPLPPAHRAHSILSAFIFYVGYIYSGAFSVTTWSEPPAFDHARHQAWIHSNLERCFRQWFDFCVLPSYRSPAGMYFDTVLLADFGRAPREVGGVSDAMQAMRRQITAALAVRTMRLRGDFNNG